MRHYIDRQRFYLDLIGLVSIKSVFADPAALTRAVDDVKSRFCQILPAWQSYLDAEGNFVGYSPAFDPARPATYLSAHIDTVDAVAGDWQGPRDPFQGYETKTHIVGRGANDCKAGIAFMLHTARLIGQNKLPGDNIVFLVSRSEEGGSKKTSVQIGRDLGRQIPLSALSNIMLCLENTVSVATPADIALYDAEPCNLFIKLCGKLTRFKAFLQDHPRWKPVCIWPQDAYAARDTVIIHGVPGHSATVGNADNAIAKAINQIRHDEHALVGGDKLQPSVIAGQASLFEADRAVDHSLILNFREYDDSETIKSDLHGIDYEEYADFELGSGSDRRSSVAQSGICQVLRGCTTKNLQFSVTGNPGRSDASAIWNYLDTATKDRIVIATIGPGSRSHWDGDIRRATHGPNEGFHKISGIRAVAFLLRFLVRRHG